MARTIKYLDTLERTARILNKPFRETTKEDIENLVAEIESKGYSEWTKHDYKVILRIFYIWFRKCENPEEVSWIKIKTRRNPKLSEELLTVEEINKLVNYKGMFLTVLILNIKSKIGHGSKRVLKAELCY